MVFLCGLQFDIIDIEKTFSRKLANKKLATKFRR